MFILGMYLQKLYLTLEQWVRPLPRLAPPPKKETEKTQINKIRNEIGNVTTDITEIKKDHKRLL